MDVFLLTIFINVALASLKYNLPDIDHSPKHVGAILI
jgi:hypothetical protein